MRARDRALGDPRRVRRQRDLRRRRASRRSSSRRSTSAARSSPSRQISPEHYLDDELEIVQETTSIESLLSTDGIRFIFSSFVNNFASFSVVAVVFVAMIGVGVAEEAGLMAALIRKLVKVRPRRR